MSSQFQTLQAELRHEIDSIKGSRFVATAAPVANLQQAMLFIERVSREYHKASHNCWAYRLGPSGAEYRSSDDGEPAGSAGRPIQLQIEGHAISDAAVVVTRWFGGTKLGVGGLMRAYGGAAGQTLDRAKLRTVLITRRLRLRFPYACSGVVDGLLAGMQLTPETSDYGAQVEMQLCIPEDVSAQFLFELGERTAGRSRIDWIDP